MWGINGLTRLVLQIAAQLDAVRTELKQLPDKARFDALERIISQMPTDQDLQAALSAFSGAVTQAVNDATTRVQTDIDGLKQQIANGGTVTQADLDAVTAAQTSALAGIAGIDPANPTPPPTP